MSILVIGDSACGKTTLCKYLSGYQEIYDPVVYNLVPVRLHSETRILYDLSGGIDTVPGVVLRRIRFVLVVWDTTNPDSLRSAKTLLHQCKERMNHDFEFLVVGTKTDVSNINTQLITVNVYDTNSMSQLRDRISDAVTNKIQPLGYITSNNGRIH